MRKLLPILIVLASVLGGCGRRVSVTGALTHSETGRPIAGAWVYDPTLDTLAIDSLATPDIEPLDGIHPNKQIVTTDSAGRYLLENISARRHFIYFAAKDFEWIKVDFKAKGRDSIFELNVKLEPEPIEVIY
ncbi:hypothetical protein CEE36_07680 [candidate division TA06 bacterium B3_TA06]|uniref:Carboxypeptidase regulatory-like domain-containing protein n=1 Tax=candidate division TA06 bacterium B3_TA06 TaxID=2012487 RepID=A0A532V4J7_UNCT6|nr:MAG: hypothetical protein CEE36_07680 [candidate division TA06 bacterium B3_TA06]